MEPVTPAPSDALSGDALAPFLGTVALGRRLLVFGQCESTQLLAKRLLDGPVGVAPHGTLVVADFQRAGLGRRGRAWAAPPGRALLFSLILRPAAPMLPEGGRTVQAASVAVRAALAAHGAPGCGIKWPNDLLAADGRKLCGILAEAVGQAVVLGIGINVNQEATDFPPDLRTAAASLRILTGREQPRAPLLAAVLNGLEAALALPPDRLHDAWKSGSCTLGREVRVRLADRTLEGRAADFLPDGRLVLALSDGRTETVAAGDVEALRPQGPVDSVPTPSAWDLAAQAPPPPGVPPAAHLPRPPGSTEWITAPATASGPAAIAVVRIDGPGCWELARRIWRPTGSAVSPPARRLVRGLVRDPVNGEALDDALLAWFPAPHSYTGNDLVELHCHGGPAVVAAVVAAVLAAGARMARPGEFTERAFFNGRMDLAQAEAVAHLVAARTRQAGRAALAQLNGGFSREIGAVRSGLLDLAADIEARIDFPEEDLPPADAQRREVLLSGALDQIRRLLRTGRRGRLLHEGARVALAGSPNAGKSSVFNALVGRERAIVTPHPGTTRDTIEATLDLQGIPVVLVDTAGLRNLPGAAEPAPDAPADGPGAALAIERLGIERSLQEISGADLVLLVADATADGDPAAALPPEALAGKTVLLVWNKTDLPAAAAAPRCFGTDGLPTVGVSAETGAGLDRLESAIAAALRGEAPDGDAETPLVTSLRHATALQAAETALARAQDALRSEPSGECAMADLHEALAALDEIDGRSVGTGILDRIFSQFCIGK